METPLIPTVPFQVMKNIERDGIDSLVVVPLYPHYSLSTSGSSMKLLYKYFKRYALTCAHSTVHQPSAQI